MKRAVLGIIVGSAGAVYADQSVFDEYSDAVPQRAALQLYEASCDLDIDMRGLVATFELRQKLVNPGPNDLAASLELGLPRGSQITSFAMRGDAGLLVDTAAPAVRGPTAVLGVDPALLRLEGEDRYRVTVQPFPPGQDALLTTRFVALAEPRAGALRLVLPGRDPPLTACRGEIRVSAGPGVAVRRIRVNNQEARGTFLIDATDVAIDIDLDLAGRVPVVWTQSQALADGWNATLITVLGPRAKPSAKRRFMFVLDGSRSMDLVGRHNVLKVIDRIGDALPADSELEAIIYDRTVTRVFGELRPANAHTIGALKTAIAQRTASNGSDIRAALARARELLDDSRPAMIIVVSDAVTGELDGAELTPPLGTQTSTLDIHAVVLDPATTRSPNADALRAAVNRFGGAIVEVNVAQLDEALASVDEWLRPAWLGLAMGSFAIPKEVRAGGGFTHLEVHRGPRPMTLTGHGDAKFSIPARPAPATPLAALALAATQASTVAGDNPTDTQLAMASATLEKVSAAHPIANSSRGFAVLTTVGRVAKSRRDMVRGGGRYERTIAVADPSTHNVLPPTPPRPQASAISRPTLERLFRFQLQPKAYACYQRALGRNTELAGVAQFKFVMGRGEVTAVSLAGLGDVELDACLVDAAFQLTPPLPDFTINADDQTIVNYPLTFQRRGSQAVVVDGDADSTSPLDIDKIKGGVPSRGGPVKVDTSTPLGRMRPPKSP